MNSSAILSNVRKQVACLQETLSISTELSEQIKQLEKEKVEALNKCSLLEVELERIKNQKCTNCTVLLNKLIAEKKERDKLKNQEKVKLLKTIAKTLESLEEANTNQLTTAHAQLLLTELVKDDLDARERRSISLISERNNSDDESHSRVLVNETVIGDESEEWSWSSNGQARAEVPETCSVMPVSQSAGMADVSHSSSVKEGRGEEDNDSHQTKKFKTSETFSSWESKVKLLKGDAPAAVPHDTTIRKTTSKSFSLLPGKMTPAENSSSFRCDKITTAKEEEESTWRMKPSMVLPSEKGRKMKQMTLNVARLEKRHDISLSGVFKGGVISPEQFDREVVPPSPAPAVRSGFSRMRPGLMVCETMDDPDMTVFNPGVTSTCMTTLGHTPVIAETSFDRLPNKSPEYKYRRDALRKRDERMKLPGQDCDQCAKYFEAAGGEDVKDRLNACSRHRDKYQLRANTPPGFWDPVLPQTPDDDS